MAELDLRVRVVGALLRHLPGANVTKMTPEQITRTNQRRIKRNRVVDALFGRLPEGVRTEDRTIPGPGGPLPLRVYTPGRPAAGPRPVVVNFHGGGWTLGNLDIGDWLCSRIADDVDAVVVSVDYRLAPTHRFPAAVDDCYAALEWTAAHAAELAGDAERVAVMGDSAGGNLATVVCLLARDRSGPRVRHQTLIYPATDLAMESPSIALNPDKPFLTPTDMHVFRHHYLGPDGDPTDWRASPLRAADHSGLPPALVVVAEHDPIRDDGVRYAEALRQAGVEVTLSEYPGMPHGFVSFPGLCRGAPKALAEIVAAQRAALAARP